MGSLQAALVRARARARVDAADAVVHAVGDVQQAVGADRKAFRVAERGARADAVGASGAPAARERAHGTGRRRERAHAVSVAPARARTRARQENVKEADQGGREM